jgi:hypothetical protein
MLRETGLCCTIVGNRYFGLCGNVVFRVRVWGILILMWTSTENVKGDRVVLYNCGEQIGWGVW